MKNSRSMDEPVIVSFRLHELNLLSHLSAYTLSSIYMLNKRPLPRSDTKVERQNGEGNMSQKV